jgi:ABC-type hemin transport system ATPase subunit
MGAPPGKIEDEFGDWMALRPKWLQSAAAKLIEAQNRPGTKEIAEFADLALAEATNRPGTAFEQFPPGVFASAGSAPDLRLSKVDKVSGVNAIRAGAKIEFGRDITVVYGQNGSGKSGFSRLMKHVCGARTKLDLLPDVFSAAPPEPQAEVTIAENDTATTLPWTLATGAVRKLRHVHVFDSATAAGYVNSKNEATYEPRRLRFLSALVDIADFVAAELGRRKSALPSKLPTITPELRGGDAEAFLRSLRHDIDDEKVDAACYWSTEDAARKTAIEASLKETDVAGKVKDVARRKKSLELFEKLVSTLKAAASDENAAIFEKAKLDAATKRKAASEDAEKAFLNSALEGIGKESWKLLWESARTYSEQAAYPTVPFPAVGEGCLCVLCHQEIGEGARTRMSEFERFVRGGIEAAAAAAEAELKRLTDALPAVPEKEKWAVEAGDAGIDPEGAEVVRQGLAARLAALRAAGTELPAPVDWLAAEEAVAATRLALAQTETALTEIQKAGKKDELEKTLKALRAREWVASNAAAVWAEVARLRLVAELDAAAALANTRALTLKKNALADEELTRGYRDRFVAELGMLGGKRLPVEPVPSQEGKGKVSFSLAFKGAKRQASTHAVLSEGEIRIVALAAFLADISGSGLQTPFVFDDPISSLDQDYEERVVDRLVALSQTRQVVVFTHRLSLLALIEDAIEAANRVATAAEPAPGLSIVTLRRIGSLVGMVDDMEVRHKKPRSGFAVLRDQRVPQIRKHMEVGNAAEYDSALKSTCGDFRILVERTVEKVMLDGLLERFRRSVQTKQIKTLAKINIGDCALIDEMMTKYSRFEHSQSDEMAGALPAVDELHEDLNKVIAWIDEFGGRAVA